MNADSPTRHAGLPADPVSITAEITLPIVSLCIKDQLGKLPTH